MKVREFIEQLEQLDPDLLIVTASYNPHRGVLENISSPTLNITIFVEETSPGNYRDVTDKERERDIPAVVIQ